jgi:hypothetical protein
MIGEVMYSHDTLWRRALAACKSPGPMIVANIQDAGSTGPIEFEPIGGVGEDATGDDYLMLITFDLKMGYENGVMNFLKEPGPGHIVTIETGTGEVLDRQLESLDEAMARGFPKDNVLVPCLKAYGTSGLACVISKVWDEYIRMIRRGDVECPPNTSRWTHCAPLQMERIMLQCDQVVLACSRTDCIDLRPQDAPFAADRNSVDAFVGQLGRMDLGRSPGGAHVECGVVAMLKQTLERKKRKRAFLEQPCLPRAISHIPTRQQDAQPIRIDQYPWNSNFEEKRQDMYDDHVWEQACEGDPELSLPWPLATPLLWPCNVP